MNKRLISKGPSVHEYEVLDYDDDITDKELIDFCDPDNYGGKVSRMEDYSLAVVNVYID